MEKAQDAPPTAGGPLLKRVAYQTRFGRFGATFQTTGSWTASYQLTVQPNQRKNAIALIRNLTASLSEIGHPGLPKLLRFDEAELSTTWRLSSLPSLEPLERQSVPWSSAATCHLLRRLAEVLNLLHAAGLGAYDLSPSLVFVSPRLGDTIIFPMPWLPTLMMWSPQKAEHISSFLAPDLEESSAVIWPDPSRADVFGLGALAWYLLTAKPRPRTGQMLPSEHDRHLVIWDAFLDGCCRRNAARRFESLSAALASLDQSTPAGSTPVSEPPIVDSPVARAEEFHKPAPNANRRMVLGAAVTVGSVGLLYSMRSVLPPVPGLSDGGRHRRGFADTIIHYANRSYSGASWQMLKESGATGEMTRVFASGDLSLCWSVAGWDDDNFVVARRLGQLFHVRNGHWSFAGKVDEPGSLRLLNPGTILITINGCEKKLFQISSQGIQDRGTILKSCNRHRQEIAPISNDLIYVFSHGEGGVGWDSGVLEVANSRSSEVSVAKHKKAFVHTPDNAVLKEYPAYAIRWVSCWKEGEAYGIAYRASAAFFDPDSCLKHVVHFVNGLWYAEDDIKTCATLRDTWFGEDHAGRFAILVGDNGYIQRAYIGGTKIEQSVRAATEPTSLSLIKVWGASADKYWVMDDNGTIWEREGEDSRVVVRGLRDRDVKFVAAWISPTGNVIAITEKHVYRLQ